MSKKPRLSFEMLRVLGIAVTAGGEVSGDLVMRATELRSGTVYPILMRLESLGWLKSKWEDIEPSELARPRRRLYRVMAAGRKAHADALWELGAKPIRDNQT
jgi:PadR family transcriptional regulator, regulatory protein PadR